MEIKISIIIPVYNTEAFLDECLDSVMNQTLGEIEIIIVNDASTDGSLEIIEKKKKKDPRIRLIGLQKNSPGGAGIPSNLGIEDARGEYIGFVDSDDVIELEMFETLYLKAEESESDIVCCDFDLINNKSGLYESSNDRYHFNFLPKEKVLALTKEERTSLMKLSPVPWRKLYRRKFLNENRIRYPEGDYFFEDTPMHFFVMAKVTRITLINDLLYHHRIFREEQSMFGKGSKFMAFLEHTQTIYQFLIDEDLLYTYCSDFLSFCYNTYSWVWYRLERKNKKKYFYELSKITRSVPKVLFESCMKEGIPWETIMLNILHRNLFSRFSLFLYMKKKGFHVMILFFDNMKQFGLANTLMKIAKKTVK